MLQCCAIYINLSFIGSGKYTFESGACYDGGYKDGLRHGSGVMTYPDGSKFDGAWFDGQKSGAGTFKYANGDTYQGMWDEDKKHGEGTMFFTDSMSQFIGMWEEGEFVKGRWVLRDGVCYEGTFVDNKPSGKGVYKFPAQKIVAHGHYTDGKWSATGEVEVET